MCKYVFLIKSNHFVTTAVHPPISRSSFLKGVAPANFEINFLDEASTPLVASFEGNPTGSFKGIDTMDRGVYILSSQESLGPPIIYILM